MLDLDSPERVSLTIKTVPADADERATVVARRLAEHLDAVGVDARVMLQSREELYRDVLLNQAFDVYVARYPHTRDPDFVRGLLHSRFDAEPGWQNPFGLADLELDELLDAQRTRTGAARSEVLRDIERTVVRDRPFSVVAFPEEIRTSRAGWRGGRTTGGTFDPLRHLTTDRADGYWAPSGASNGTDAWNASESSTRAEEPGVRSTITDVRVTRNRNPLAVEFRTGGPVLGLVYDSLGRPVDGEVRPWLAADWEWDVTHPGEGRKAVVSLREDLSWHDGTELSAEDVAFTYQFLADTSLGRLESPIPAPRYRAESSLVESADVRSDGRVELRFRPANKRVARRAFTVPLLPRHVWEERSGTADISGIETGRGVTEALVWNNPEPVGSGPYRFERASPKESVVLSRFEDHPLGRASDAGLPPGFEANVPFDEARFPVVPSGMAAVELVRRGEADTTLSPVSAAAVPAIGRAESLELDVSRASAFYHVGFNVRRSPTSNTRFRRAVASLVDRGHVVDEVFDGYAVPSVSPLGGGNALSPELEWEGEDPVLPFPGSDGRLNESRARERFREAGYRYGESGALLTR
jgi:peptide/nickel transport system substrate-binding protein